MQGSAKKLAVLALSAIVTATSIIPSYAIPMPQPDLGGARVAGVQEVQYYHHRPPPRRGWYHGHRGYDHYRPGYRRHSDGWWYPLAAFGAGAIIGGAIASQPSRPAEAGINPRHTDWCYSRYRSYRAYDNTFQPNYGPRRQCYSPYY
ncbi:MULTISPECIES: BA14K family protein [unclassified Sinorhizobium]|uniref:BA14K family protein n=1 Tax=unclassified Sinorhizobium TaxID=2613772 RepID=UPI003523A89A